LRAAEHHGDRHDRVQQAQSATRTCSAHRQGGDAAKATTSAHGADQASQTRLPPSQRLTIISHGAHRARLHIDPGGLMATRKANIDNILNNLTDVLSSLHCAQIALLEGDNTEDRNLISRAETVIAGDLRRLEQIREDLDAFSSSLIATRSRSLGGNPRVRARPGDVINLPPQSL
jgi:hypothetical protein